MGLPLFVAPVESDLASKSADKNSATSPSRSGIRRAHRSDPRDRRAALRRHMSIRDRVHGSSLRQSSTLSGGASEQLGSSYIDHISRPRPFREVLREVVRSDSGTRDRFEEHLHQLFGGASVPDRETRDNDIDESAANLGFWAIHPMPPSSRTRLPNSNPNSLWPPPAGVRSSQRDEAESRPPLSRAHIHVIHPRGPRASSETELMSRRQVAEIHARATNAALGRIREVNGLGDRQRSLSPEVWDTLLTTLTPDPQPPSAGSSFASTVASQSAGVSSGTALTTPEAAEGETADQACESGCENSDSDGADYEHPHFSRIRRRREAMRRVRLRVPEYNVDGPADGPADGPVDGPVDSPADGALERLRAFTAWDSERRTTSEARRAMEEPTGNAVGHGNLSLSQFRRPRHGWVGQLSVGTSDDELGTDRRSLNRESSTQSGNNTSLGDDDLTGMRHIVHSLARREDIPDEWWAEAGLSRTIP